ncbi:MAG: 4Fe-4S dicluster domain-containing protein [Ignavibacteria bacterium]|nr:4Fe-4S dicluster domain-containing protein [Ignavibacteria bacterium]
MTTRISTPDHFREAEMGNERGDLSPNIPFSRRTFLKAAGFTFAGGLLAGCERGRIEKAIPFLVKPEEMTPGVATWYASTCGGCSAGCGVLVKNRDGRPIKIEGNPDHPLSQGGLCPTGQAYLLPLYDSTRLLKPLSGGEETTWEAQDKTIAATLEEIRRQNGSVRLLTGTMTSPSSLSAVNRFIQSFRNATHVMYDGLSASAILDAQEITFGKRILPQYRLDRAEVIVGVDADFLGSWISPVEFSSAYSRGRTLTGGKKTFSHHTQIESHLSLTGSNADMRISASPGEALGILRSLASVVSKRTGRSITVHDASQGHEEVARELAERLLAARGRGLVVCGTNHLESQLLVNIINHALGNYGNTLTLSPGSLQKRGSDRDFGALAEEMRNGKIDALIVVGVNPVYDAPGSWRFGDLLQNVPLTVVLGDRRDETSSRAEFVCPIHHPLEGWSDAQPIEGMFALRQPTISPIGQTRELVETLSAWSGQYRSSYDQIRSHWLERIHRRAGGSKPFDRFWDDVVREGSISVPADERTFTFNTPGVQQALAHSADSPRSADGIYDLVLYANASMLDGRNAHNPWLQELPDPVTKIVWDNYASISQAAARSLGVKEGDVVEIRSGDVSIKIPVHIQPGHHDGVVAVALGYGRMGTDRFTSIGPEWLEAKPTVLPGDLVGTNAAPFIQYDGQHVDYRRGVSIQKTGKRHELASTQEHHSLHVPEHLRTGDGERRPIIQETTYRAYVREPSSGSFPKHKLVSMWPDAHEYKGHHWGMAIDLTACTGCSACVIGCQAENNIPSVGKDEVRRNREMTWIRVDRYYTEENGETTVAHQPMMCHHCDNAPCETVCPVLATVHSEEGLNQQVYNRCVGTRYCANNCPYKIRRFNWFDYEHGDDLHKMVLNPDVTVRERGIMEKCTFCIQRIQEARIVAKSEGRSIRDGDIKTACEQSCPTRAIVFGDMNDPQSELTKRMNDPRHYRVLEELGVRPSVGYLTLVTNREEGEGGPANG